MMMMFHRNPIHICAGCSHPITDRVLLVALDKPWHARCLNCSCCGVSINEFSSSLYVRSDSIFCRNDYLRLFGNGGVCAKCRISINPDELVMKCNEYGQAYHLKCFSCALCDMILQPGDRYIMTNGQIICENEFPRIFGKMQNKIGNNNNNNRMQPISNVNFNKMRDKYENQGSPRSLPQHLSENIENNNPNLNNSLFRTSSHENLERDISNRNEIFANQQKIN